MNILIIGNGFDLAHNLPTKYTDILEFLRIIKITSTWMGDQPSFISKHLNIITHLIMSKNMLKMLFQQDNLIYIKVHPIPICSYKKFMII